MSLSTKMRAALAAGACAAIGAGAGIAGSAAAPSSSSSKSSTAASKTAAGHRGRPPGDGHGPGGRAVHAQEVVLNKAGTAFITETDDHGTVASVSGDDVTIHEAAGSVDYNDVTLTIPDDATIVRNGANAAVGDLKTGDHIDVRSSSDGTSVFAADASFRPSRSDRGPGGPGGPPPTR